MFSRGDTGQTTNDAKVDRIPNESPLKTEFMGINDNP